MSVRIYDLTIPFGETRVIEVAGDFFKVVAVSAQSVEVRTQNGLTIECAKGQGIRNTPFERLLVKATQATVPTSTVKIVAGDSDFVDDTFYGQLEVIDGGQARTIDGNAGLAGVSATAAAGLFPIFQVFNNSQLSTIAVKAITIFGGVSGASGTIFKSSTAALLASGLLSDQFAASKFSGSNSILTATCRSAQVAALPAGLQPLFNVQVPPLVGYTRTFTEPIVLDYFGSLFVHNATLASTLTCDVEFVRIAK